MSVFEGDWLADVLAVTCRSLCTSESFSDRIRRLAASGAKAIVLREKDLSEDEYEALAENVLQICKDYEKMCILHYYPEVAERLGAEAIHLPLWKLKETPDLAGEFLRVGVSVHSPEEAQEAEGLGASYLIAGHIFETGCKPGLAPRGMDFLKKVCEQTALPVYAIGGMGKEHLPEAKKAGAAGICMMSGLMRG